MKKSTFSTEIHGTINQQLGMLDGGVTATLPVVSGGLHSLMMYWALSTAEHMHRQALLHTSMPLPLVASSDWLSDIFPDLSRYLKFPVFLVGRHSCVFHCFAPPLFTSPQWQGARRKCKRVESTNCMLQGVYQPGQPGIKRACHTVQERTLRGSV